MYGNRNVLDARAPMPLFGGRFWVCYRDVYGENGGSPQRHRQSEFPKPTRADHGELKLRQIRFYLSQPESLAVFSELRLRQ